jgi:antitoxin component of MazEF toxin-antitoxin module
MRAVLATVVAALAVAAPAAAITIPKNVAGKLRVSPAVAVAFDQVTKSDKLHSCQAGDRRARTAETSAAQTERKAAVVACEQPPRSNLLTPDSVAKATAAALSVIG